jgi:hypothetical protein
VIARNGRIADSFKTRLIGLLDQSCLPEGEALIITRCQSVHMMFMRFSIDVLFVDKNDKIVGLVHGIKPFRLSPLFPRSSYAVEVPTGTIVQTKTSVGDSIELKEIQ